MMKSYQAAMWLFLARGPGVILSCGEGDAILPTKTHSSELPHQGGSSLTDSRLTCVSILQEQEL